MTATAKKEKQKCYSSKLTAEQNAAFHRYESVSGFEPFGFEDFEAGLITARELWRQNEEFIFDIYSQVQNISYPTDD
ncbi:hypothetical protein [Gulbenkiania mobilis]|uniref:hypothetical protein n=1 Tax=Gulbenkiania mobilis TaxID=397457 RepID=UPI0006BBB876|nr:hypothetical protein [Gulbenkiania mobilis]